MGIFICCCWNSKELYAEPIYDKKDKNKKYIKKNIKYKTVPGPPVIKKL